MKKLFNFILSFFKKKNVVPCNDTEKKFDINVEILNQEKPHMEIKKKRKKIKKNSE